MAGRHSLWSPSSAKRWRSCGGSVVMNDGAPDKTGKEAAEGSVYHGLSEETLTGKYAKCADAVGESREMEGFRFTIKEEDADYAQEYVDRIRARAHAGCIVSIEVRTNTSEILGIPEQGGTIDARIFDIAQETIEIRDLKFGRGVKVYVRDPDGKPNGQVFTYGWSELRATLYMCDWQWLKLVIDQPRIGHYDEITLSREECEKLATELYADAQRSYALWQRFKDDATGLQAHLTPSLDACRWCAMAGSCKARAQKILNWFPTKDKLPYMVEIPVTAKNLPTISGPELEACLDRVDEIEQWVRSVRAEAMTRVEQKTADAPRGWKLVEGRKGDRTANPDDIKRRAMQAVCEHEGIAPGSEVELPQALYTDPELKSIAQLEKACKKIGDVGKAIWKSITGDPEKGVPSLITQGQGRPTLVRDFDARPELAIQPVTFDLRPVGEEFSAGQNKALIGAEGLM